jgi:hypothetical protein
MEKTLTDLGSATETVPQKGAKSVTVYADASLTSEVRVGGWAYSMPGLKLNASGVVLAPQSCSDELEMLAVTMGLKRLRQESWVVGLVKVFSDSEAVHRFLQAFINKKLPKAETDIQLKLRDELQTGCHARYVCVPYTRGNRHHIWCHTAARLVIRQYIASDSALTAQLVSVRHVNQIAALLKGRDRLRSNLAAVENELNRTFERGDDLSAGTPK